MNLVQEIFLPVPVPPIHKVHYQLDAAILPAREQIDDFNALEHLLMVDEADGVLDEAAT
jgi:hypothetical protein